jgi:hypothetical protein
MAIPIRVMEDLIEEVLAGVATAYESNTASALAQTNRRKRARGNIQMAHLVCTDYPKPTPSHSVA